MAIPRTQLWSMPLIGRCALVSDYVARAGIAAIASRVQLDCLTSFLSERVLTIDLKSWETYRVEPDSRTPLKEISTGATDYCTDKAMARATVKKYRKQINELVSVLATEGRRSVLVILQGVDASGKDGAVRRVFTGVNPQHCRVISFKEPNREEKAHDYLWRICRSAPVKGELRIFNRSQYEDVLVPRAHGELSAREVNIRLRQISEMERSWTESGIVIRKFFLHVSRKEQGSRFQERLDNPEKHWKVQASDFADRKLWPKFHQAYEAVLSRTSTDYAPWYAVPADHKWYRDIVIAGVVLSTLRAMRPRPPMPPLDPKMHRL